jgi:flagellin-like hook-associated protein FlgL
MYLSADNALWDGLQIEFLSPATNTANTVTVSEAGGVVTIDAGPDATYDEILTALNGTWASGSKPATGMVKWVDSAGAEKSTAETTKKPTSTLSGSTTTLGAYQAAVPAHDLIANDIRNLFDLTKETSRGSERAASLFTVTNTADNDGKGLIHLYNYNDATGEALKAKTAFEKAFKNGATGGDVVTTAAELVTALNNSAYWGMTMCPELIAELAYENATTGKYYDITDPPVITASLAPGQHGLFAINAFEEVAYYGDPNEGNALQFLGEKNSPNIRFVAEAGNSELWIDRTTVPDVISNAQAVLTAQDSGASMTITSVKKGEEYDDVQFVFKRVSEAQAAGLPPDRKDGWVEYDPGTSKAEAEAVFRDAVDSTKLLENTAFFITADGRGEISNNVGVMMRLDDTMIDNEDGLNDGVTVSYDTKTNQLRIALDSTKVGTITSNDVIAAINNSNFGFTAERSYSADRANNGTGTFASIGLTTGTFKEIANTGETGGHLGGTVTVWLADEEPTTADGVYIQPTQDDVVRLINNDPVVGRLFTAKAYNTVQNSDGQKIDFIKDGPIVTSGGLVEKGAITVHLVTDKYGLVQTTAKDLETWWNQQDPATVENISASIVRPAGAVWDECNDPYGNGLLAPTTSLGDCDQLIVDDIQFVGWNDNIEQQTYLSQRAKGTMTSQRGINSSYDFVAKQYGPEWNGWTVQYINDDSLTGRYADNIVEGADVNPCDDEEYVGLERDDCGNLITPLSGTEKGMRLDYNDAEKKITVYVRFGTTTANDVEQLIESDVRTRNKFEINQLGDGTGYINSEDDTLLTKDGALPPGGLNGAKLLFGSDASNYNLVFKSSEYGSKQFVNVIATATDGGDTSFKTTNAAGVGVEKTYGKDVDALVNGVKAGGDGLNVSMNTSTLALDLTLGENAGTTTGWGTSFSITGGGATYQIGPDVVSKQQITLGIQSVDTVRLGGASGKLFQLRSNQDADLSTDTNKAFRIVEEALLTITSIRGRLGTMQKATFETNINVLNDTMSALTEAESQIRDTDFAEETSNLTRAQILVQANMNTLGIANQLPNYMLSLLGG